MQSCDCIFTWTKKNNFPYSSAALVSFSINGIGYAGMGNAGGQNFYKYNQGTDTWMSIASFPGSGNRTGCSSFVINGIAYVGFGYNGLNQSDFYSYNPIFNTWTARASGPPARVGMVSFAIGGKGYIATGGVVSSSALNDLWEYDPISDTWTQKANFPSSARAEAAGFSINNYGYVGNGLNGLGGVFNDWYKYTPGPGVGGGSWISITSYPTATYQNHYFQNSGYGYVGRGIITGVTSDNAFYKYDPILDTWCSFAYDPTMTICCSTNGSFTIGNKSYIVGGITPSITVAPDVWELSTTCISCTGFVATITKNIIQHPNYLNGRAKVVVTGGTPPYTYLWSNGETDTNISGLPAGPISVTVTDSNMCIVEATATIYIGSGGCPNIPFHRYSSKKQRCGKKFG